MSKAQQSKQGSVLSRLISSLSGSLKRNHKQSLYLGEAAKYDSDKFSPYYLDAYSLIKGMYVIGSR